MTSFKLGLKRKSVKMLIWFGGLLRVLCIMQRTSAPLFWRKLVLGIPAQASSKNDMAINAYGAPVHPAFVSLCHIMVNSMQTP
jgi:hypothetical protein